MKARTVARRVAKNKVNGTRHANNHTQQKTKAYAWRRRVRVASAAVRGRNIIATKLNVRTPMSTDAVVATIPQICTSVTTDQRYR
jgi:hypothetical protein